MATDVAGATDYQHDHERFPTNAGVGDSHSTRGRNRIESGLRRRQLRRSELMNIRAMNKRFAGLLWMVATATALCVAQEGSSVSKQPPASADKVETKAVMSENAGDASVGPTFQQRYSRYKLEFGDQFDVSFELSPEFNQTVTVQPDGYITLRGAGDVHVVGQTVPQLTETLKQAYGKILKDPVISVVLKDFEKPYFIADGQVGKPGKYELRGETTLTQAIAMAGGFNDAAKHSQVLLFRRVNSDWVSAKIINVKEMEKKGDLHEDPYLHPGDMLFVPKNRLSKVKPFLPTASMGTFLNPY
jgi:polysaccharide export outer membrane protein